MSELIVKNHLFEFDKVEYALQNSKHNEDEIHIFNFEKKYIASSELNEFLNILELIRKGQADSLSVVSGDFSYVYENIDKIIIAKLNINQAFGFTEIFFSIRIYISSHNFAKIQIDNFELV